MPVKTTTTPEKYLMTKNNDNNTDTNGTVTPIYPRTSIDNIVKSTTDNTTLQSVLDGKQSTITVNPSTTTATLSGLGIDGTNYAVGGGGIKRISDQYDIYIWDLDPGIYILDAPYTENTPFKYIHYYGKNTSTSYRIAVGRGSGQVMLFVTCSRPGTISSATITFKTWYIIYMDANQTTASSPIMYWGYTGQSTGAAKSCLLDAMVRSSGSGTTTTADKVVLSTTSAGVVKYSNWSTAGVLKTNTSGVVSIDSNIVPVIANPSSSSSALTRIGINGTNYSITSHLYHYKNIRLATIRSLGSHSSDTTYYEDTYLMASFDADISTFSGKTVYFYFDVEGTEGPNYYCTGVKISNCKVYVGYEFYQLDGDDDDYQYSACPILRTYAVDITSETYFTYMEETYSTGGYTFKTYKGQDTYSVSGSVIGTGTPID